MTITRTRSMRRVLRPFAVAALIVVTMAGCHYTRTATGSVVPGVCKYTDNGESVYEWTPAPGTVRVRLKISSSNSTYPISAMIVSPELATEWWEPSRGELGALWDGVRSTGSKEVSAGRTFATNLTIHFRSSDPLWASRTFTYQVTPLDSAGNETSFIDCPPELD